jgi:exopolyphosphatase/guanosine-5'-triphosphate,3'-diphosphate pyrophosphatase
MTLRQGAIDIGTNTTLLLLAEARGDEVTVLAERAEITRLGRGIGGDGRLGAEGIARTLAVLAEYAALARSHGAPLAVVGTEALRRAPNADEFLRPAAAVLGGPVEVEVEVIDGQREAALSYRAASRSFPEAAAGSMVVVDIGGGSTEIIRSEGGVVTFRRSLPLGSVRLTERHIRHDPAAADEVAAVTAEVRQALAAVPIEGAQTLVGTAGTVTSLAAMDQKLVSYDPALVHGYPLTLSALEGLVQTLLHTPQAERERMPGLDPRRADVILAGACILLEIARRVGVSRVITSDRGLRWGLLYERLEPQARQPLADGRTPG